MSRNENSVYEIDKTALLEKLKKLNDKMDSLGDFCTPNAYLLVGLCDEFESLLDDLIAVMEGNFTAIAYRYEGVRRECESATKHPDKDNESYLSIKEYYDRGKRHLQQTVKMLMSKLKINK